MRKNTAALDRVPDKVNYCPTNSASFLLGECRSCAHGARWTCPSGCWLGFYSHCLSICPRTRRSTSAGPEKKSYQGPPGAGPSGGPQAPTGSSRALARAPASVSTAPQALPGPWGPPAGRFFCALFISRWLAAPFAALAARQGPLSGSAVNGTAPQPQRTASCLPLTARHAQISTSACIALPHSYSL